MSATAAEVKANAEDNKKIEALVEATYKPELIRINESKVRIKGINLDALKEELIAEIKVFLTDPIAYASTRDNDYLSVQHINIYIAAIELGYNVDKSSNLYHLAMSFKERREKKAALKQKQNGRQTSQPINKATPEEHKKMEDMGYKPDNEDHLREFREMMADSVPVNTANTADLTRASTQSQNRLSALAGGPPPATRAFAGATAGGGQAVTVNPQIQHFANLFNVPLESVLSGLARLKKMQEFSDRAYAVYCKITTDSIDMQVVQKSEVLKEANLFVENPTNYRKREKQGVFSIITASVYLAGLEHFKHISDTIIDTKSLVHDWAMQERWKLQIDSNNSESAVPPIIFSWQFAYSWAELLDEMGYNLSMVSPIYHYLVDLERMGALQNFLDQRIPSQQDMCDRDERRLLINLRRPLIKELGKEIANAIEEHKRAASSAAAAASLDNNPLWTGKKWNDRQGKIAKTMTAKAVACFVNACTRHLIQMTTKPNTDEYYYEMGLKALILGLLQPYSKVWHCAEMSEILLLKLIKDGKSHIEYKGKPPIVYNRPIAAAATATATNAMETAQVVQSQAVTPRTPDLSRPLLYQQLQQRFETRFAGAAGTDLRLSAVNESQTPPIALSYRSTYEPIVQSVEPDSDDEVSNEIPRLRKRLRTSTPTSGA